MPDNITRDSKVSAMAMMRGKLKVRGDMAVAMKLQPILARARG